MIFRIKASGSHAHVDLNELSRAAGAFEAEPLGAVRSMAGTWSVALLEVFTLLWTLSRADAIDEANATTIWPFTTLNVTVSGVESSSSAWAVVGRVAVALCVAGAVGVILYCLKKKCPRGSRDGERQLVVSRRRANRESRPLNGDMRSNTSQSSLSTPTSD